MRLSDSKGEEMGRHTRKPDGRKVTSFYTQEDLLIVSSYPQRSRERHASIRAVLGSTADPLL